MAPTFAFSQAPVVTARTDADRTHVVRRGDTLWDLAREYANDPLRWRDIYALNTAVVRDPHWIYPGERLRLPGSAAADATAAPRAAAVVAPATQAPQERPREDLAVPLASAPMSAPPTAPLIFRRAMDQRVGRVALTRAVQTSSQAQPRAPAPTLRPGEVLAAPYVERMGGPANAGRIIGTGDVPGIPLTESERPLQSYERVFVVLPPGMSSAAGTRYVAVRPGPVLEGVGQVMIPTGVVAVERAQAGQAVEARIVARFEPMLIGDQLVTMEAVPQNLSRPAAVSGGAATSVLWAEGEPVLPSLQSYLVLDSSSAAGLRPGDQVTFYRERRTTADGTMLPESAIAVAQIVRVTAQAASAIIIDQTFAAIEPGTRGRVSAKMP